LSQQRRSPPDQAIVISAVKHHAAISAIAPLGEQSPGSTKRLGKEPGRRKSNRTQPVAGDTDDPFSARSDNPALRQDLAFQKAMIRAIASGLEHPPMMGIQKDSRRLIAPRLFEPVPHHSGCTSPASECADLASLIDEWP
jgi:hypothetical protein